MSVHSTRNSGYAVDRFGAENVLLVFLAEVGEGIWQAQLGVSIPRRNATNPFPS